MRWQLLSEIVPQSLEDLDQILLNNRKITNFDEFINPVHPLDLTTADVGISQSEFDKALDLIHRAKEKKQKVIIVGDYDADGICATAILWRVLHDSGVEVSPFIPSREKHGYGVSLKALADIEKEFGLPDLLITVDNGIVAHEAISYLKQKNVQVILTDHHQPEKDGDRVIYPKADAIVHTTSLCGATISWMLSRGVSAKLAKKELDLCAIATIADQVKLVGANRSFAKHGLDALRETQRLGLRELFKKTKIDQKKINATTIGYILAPRINAMGRLAHGLDALRLLCTHKTSQATELSEVLSQTNAQRQELTLDLVEMAKNQAEKQKNQKIIIVSSSEFHEGVVGLIAGRLTEIYSRPAIVITLGEKFAKASARSLPGVNIIEMLRVIRSEFLEVGGHPMAAGFGFEVEKLEVIREKLLSLSDEMISDSDLESGLDIDCLLPHDLLTTQTVDYLSKFEPFGQGNPKPVFKLDEMKVVSVDVVGNGAKHLKLQLLPSQATNSNIAIKPITAMWWRQGDMAAEFESGHKLSLAAQLEVNQWKSRRVVQLVVSEIAFID